MANIFETLEREELQRAAQDASELDRLAIAGNALEAVLKVGRGTSGRLILEAADEQAVRDALARTSPVPTKSPGFKVWHAPQTPDQFNSTP